MLHYALAAHWCGTQRPFEAVGDANAIVDIARPRRRFAAVCADARRRSRRPMTCWHAGELETKGLELDEIEFSWVRQTARRV
jgi:hypothetical protein